MVEGCGVKRKNTSRSKRKDLTGRGTVGKAAVAGAKDRATNRVSARTVGGTDRAMLQGFVRGTAKPGASVYTDDAAAYRGMSGFRHEAVNPSAGEYVRQQAHTNGVRSFWAMLKRGYQGAFYYFNTKHLNCYVTEFSGRHNDRDADTADMITHMAKGMGDKRHCYRDLVA